MAANEVGSLSEKQGLLQGSIQGEMSPVGENGATRGKATPGTVLSRLASPSSCAVAALPDSREGGSERAREAALRRGREWDELRQLPPSPPRRRRPADDVRRRPEPRQRADHGSRVPLTIGETVILLTLHLHRY